MSRAQGVTGAMSLPVMDAVRSLTHDTLEIVDQLTPSEWAAESACHGWRVQDVVAHLAFFLHTIADPRLPLPDNPGGTTETSNDAAVAERADWPAARVRKYYADQAVAGAAALDALQREPLRDKPIRLNELGTYRLHQLADAVVFDHLVHLTCDLLAPYGPLTGTVSIGTAVDPCVDWMAAGLPQMCGASLAPLLGEPIELRLVDATERTFRLARSQDDPSLVEVSEIGAGGDDLSVDVATTSTVDFLRWATRRSPWRGKTQLEGDRARLAALLDRIRVI